MSNHTERSGKQVSAAWAARADELADWALRRLTNRLDASGGYRPPEEWGKVVTGRDGKQYKLGRTTTRKGRLTRGLLARHFAARGRSDLIGLHSTSTANTSLWGGVDIDWHGPTSTAPEVNRRAALAWYERVVGMGFRPLLVDGSGTGSFHLWILLAEPAPTPRLFHWLRLLVSDHGRHGMKRPPETFPKQALVRPRPDGSPGFGNWLRVPGRHHTQEHWSRVWDGSRWLEGADAVAFILALPGDPPTLIPEVPPPPPRPAPPPPGAPPLTGGDLTSRITAYMARLPRLGEGQGRDDVAFHFACFLARDLALCDEFALGWLLRWDDGNAVPKGREALQEILANAHRYGRQPYGAGLHSPPARPRRRHSFVPFSVEVG